MSLVKVSTTRSLVRVSKQVDGAIEQTVDVQALPISTVRVSTVGFRPITELFTAFQFAMDGTPNPVEAGRSFDVNDIPFPCRLLSWTLTADQPTDAAFTIGKSDFPSFPAFTTVTGALPALANVSKATGDTSNWNIRDLTTDDMLQFTVARNSAALRLTLALRVARLSS